MRRKSDKIDDAIRCPRCDSARLKLMKPVFSMPDYKCKKCGRVFKIIKSCWLEIIV